MKIEKQYDEMNVMFDEYDEFEHFKNVCRMIKKMKFEFTNDEILKLFYATFECENDEIEKQIKQTYIFNLLNKYDFQTIEQKSLIEQLLMLNDKNEMIEHIETYKYKKTLFEMIYEILIDEFEQNTCDDLFDDLMIDNKFETYAKQSHMIDNNLNALHFDNMNKCITHELDEIKNEMQNELFEQTYVYVTNEYLI